jgi:transposase-like protein
MKKNKPWTEEDNIRLLNMRASGCSIASVARELGRSTASIQLRLTGLRRREREAANAPQGLRPMKTFNAYEPAIIHDRETDKMETWTGEHAADFGASAIFNPDGTVEWRSFLFDGWGNVLGG